VSNLPKNAFWHKANDDLHSTLPLVKLGPLECLAWSALSDDEIIERLANEVWKKPCLRSFRKGKWETSRHYGRVGITRSKVASFTRIYARGRTPAQRLELDQRLMAEAQEILAVHVDQWAYDVCRAMGQPWRWTELPGITECLVPRGARNLVKKEIRSDTLI